MKFNTCHGCGCDPSGKNIFHDESLLNEEDRVRLGVPKEDNVLADEWLCDDCYKLMVEAVQASAADPSDPRCEMARQVLKQGFGKMTDGDA